MLSGYSGLGGCHSRILDRWTATQAAPKAPQRKRPCRSRALSLILAVRSLKLRVREPRQGLVAFSLTDQAPVRCSAPCAECSCARGTPVATGYRAPHWQAGLNASLARRCQTRRRLGPAGHNPHAHSRHPRDCRAGPPSPSCRREGRFCPLDHALVCAQVPLFPKFCRDFNGRLRIAHPSCHHAHARRSRPANGARPAQQADRLRGGSLD
jgi:hypothetical protein